MRFIVTGGAGFIGSHLTDALVAQGHDVVVVDNLYAGKKENVNRKAKLEKVDIRRYEKLLPVFRGADGVFHLAAIPRVPVSVINPLETTEVNIQGTLNVFWAAKNAGVKRVVYASSSSVYGNQKTLPLVETMTPKPVSPYALQKHVGEEFARLFKELYDFPVISLRFFNVYGPRVDLSSEYSLVIGKFLKQRMDGKPLTIFGDGEQSRGFSYVTDVAAANIAAMMSRKVSGAEVINVGSTSGVTVNRIAELIGGERQYFPPRAGDILHTKADLTKAKELLGWEPKVDFDAGLLKVKEYFGVK
ncbi:L-arabinose 1-dehydrogenase (NAD(P)(+)) [uncultured archaeon]|nr:L-arabinose 1-dehydrogenase (NAD(P)(+)) [uncultured archaeon]